MKWVRLLQRMSSRGHAECSESRSGPPADFGPPGGTSNEERIPLGNDTLLSGLAAPIGLQLMRLLPEPLASRFPQCFLDDATQSLALSAGSLFEVPRQLCR